MYNSANGNQAIFYLNTPTGRWYAGAAIVGAGIYVLAGYLLAPAAVERRVVQSLAQHTDLAVSVERVRFNPFTLTATFETLTGSGPGAIASAQVDSVTINFGLGQLFGRGWRAHSLVIVAPELVLAPSRAWSDVLPALVNPSTMVDLRHVLVHDGALDLTAGPGLRLSGIETTGENIGRGSGQFALRGVMDDAGELSVAGSLDMTAGVLRAQATLAEIDIGKFNLPLAPDAGLTLSSGVLASDARIDVRDKLLTVRGDLALTRVALRAAGASAPVFNAAAVAGDAVTLRLAPFAIDADVLRITRPELTLQRAEDGAWSGSTGVLAFAREALLTSMTRIEISDGQMLVTDATTVPPAPIALRALHGQVVRDAANQSTSGNLAGQLAAGNVTRLTANWRGTGTTANGSWQLMTQNLDARLMSPWLRAMTGYDATAGTLDLTLDGTVRDGTNTGTSTVDLAGLQLARHDQAAAWPLGLVAALLEDSGQRISTRIPLSVTNIADGQSLSTTLLDDYRQFVAGVADAPFAVLEELVSAPDAGINEIPFDAGSAAINAAAGVRLNTLAAALQQRPTLGLNIAGRFAPQADRDALARQQMRLHIALATSAGPPGRATRDALDLTNPRVTAIIEEFAGKRLGAAPLAALRARADADGTNFHQAAFNALVDNETVAQRALNSLARYRAQTIASELATRSIAPERLFVATQTAPATRRDAAVLLTLTATSR